MGFTLADFYLWQVGRRWLGKALGGLRCRNFFILSTSRTGSTMLVDYLNCHGKVHCHGEILRHDHVRGESADRVRLHLESYYMKRPGRLVGSKLFVDHFETLPLTLNDVIALLGRPKVIVLYRENLLDRYVSLQIALRTCIWNSKAVVQNERIRIERQQLLDFVQRDCALWQECLGVVTAQCDVASVTYEQLSKEPQTAMHRLWGFLGVSPCTVSTKLIRLNPRPLAEKIANYDELRGADVDWAGVLQFSPFGLIESSKQFAA